MSRTRPANSAARVLLILLLLVLGLGTAPEPGNAEEGQAYVSNLNITVRRGPGIDYKIISFLRPGDEVEDLGRESGWAHVRFENDRTGWVLERYLTQTPSLISRQNSIMTENERLKQAEAMLEKSNVSLRAYFDRPIQVEQTKEPAPAHSTQDLVRALSLARQLLREERGRVDFLRRQKEMEDELSRWFLIGSGAAGLGMVLGVLTYRSRLWFRSG